MVEPEHLKLKHVPTKKREKKGGVLLDTKEKYNFLVLINRYDFLPISVETLLIRQVKSHQE